MNAETFEQAMTEYRAVLAKITDQELAEMRPFEREFVLRQRAALHAYERGDTETLDSMLLSQLQRMRELG